MATINDLGKSISDMSDDELIERLRELRQSRRTPKASQKRAAAKPKQKPLDLNAAANMLSDEARKKLIETLEGRK